MDLRRNIFICIILVLVSGGVFFLIGTDPSINISAIIFSPDFTLKQLAEKNNVPVNKILHILSHGDPSVWGLTRERPIRTIVNNPETVKNAIEHIKEDSGSARDVVKYMLWAFYLSAILLFVSSRKTKMNVRALFMVFTVLLFGIVLGASPNPMESLVKLFKLLKDMEGAPKIILSVFFIFTFFSIIGPKFICSWGCHLGALQECIFNIPVFKRKYAVKVPFILSLGSRIVIFSVFISLLFGVGFGILFGVKNFVLYHHVNYFKIFNFHELAVIALYSLPIFILLSVLVYRPFCHFICPFGLYSWILENAALNKISINEKKCIKCGKCVSVCPTEVMNYIYSHKRKFFLPDCWSCKKCIDICPVNAIEYKGNKK